MLALKIYNSSKKEGMNFLVYCVLGPVSFSSIQLCQDRRQCEYRGILTVAPWPDSSYFVLNVDTFIIRAAEIRDLSSHWSILFTTADIRFLNHIMETHLFSFYLLKINYILATEAGICCCLNLFQC